MLQRQPRQLLNGEGEEQVEAPTDDEKRVVERPTYLLLGALDGRRIGHAPMRDHGLPREDGTRLSGAVADGDHEVPVLFEQPVHTSGTSARPDEPVSLQCFDGMAVHM